MAFDPQWLLYAVLFILVVVLVVRYGKALLLVGALLALVAVAWAWGEQATATRQVATAATVSAAGQTAGSVTATVLATLLVVVLLAAGGAVVYLWLRMKALERQASGAPRASRWVAGPNARWEQAEPASRALPTDPLGQLVQLEVLRTLRELRSVRQQPALTDEDEADSDGNISWPW
ncbi:MAG TPA: hypothetical protein PKL16_11345 [Anaerolineae bacterium]|nr:hypothetical protein [Anaerolineae bacterium]HQM14929.1 hypothetical protein [Anaerolineae bacterium]